VTSIDSCPSWWLIDTRQWSVRPATRMQPDCAANLAYTPGSSLLTAGEVHTEDGALPVILQMAEVM
jgi:hypothetical protein